MDQMFAKREALKEYVVENARQGDVQNIVDTIDQYCWTKQWMMNVGDQKGKILDQALREKQPKTVLELGKETPRSVNPYPSIFSLFRNVFGIQFVAHDSESLG